MDHSKRKNGRTGGSEPTQYELENASEAFRRAASAWETSENIDSLRSAPVSIEETLSKAREAIHMVLDGELAACRKMITKLPVGLLELIPDRAWNLIHLGLVY